MQEKYKKNMQNRSPIKINLVKVRIYYRISIQMIHFLILSLDWTLHNETERCELMQEISERVQVETTCIDQNPKVSQSE